MGDLFESYGIEFEKGFQISVWKDNDLCRALDIDSEQLSYLIERTGKKCKELGWKLSFNVNFIKEVDGWAVTTIGMYLLISISSELKKYNYFEKLIPHFTSVAINDLIRYQGFKQKKSKSKLSDSNKEFRNEYFENPDKFDAKQYDSDLKTPDLDIDDKSHLFYDKKVVITGGFENYPNRKDMAIMIKKVGGNNNGSISSKTDYAVVGSEAGPKKLELIELHSTKVINEIEFIELFKDLDS